MPQYKLIKVSSNENALRTAEVVGDVPALPEVGKRFVLYSDPLDIEFGVRYIATSPVTRVFDGGRSFETENSTYQLELI